MKRFSKTISISLSMLILFSTSAALTSAAAECPISQVQVIKCTNDSCGDLQKLADQCNTSNCDLNELFKFIGGNACPDEICSTDTPVMTPAQTSAPSSEPFVPAVPEVIPANQTPVETQSTEFNAAYENEVISLVNAERAKYGLTALEKDAGASAAAHIRAKEIVQSFSHTRPDGRSCFTAAQEAGISYRYAGENIAYGYPTPENVVNGWMNSEGHRKNILSSSFTKIGVGCFESNGTLYWTQFFIG